MAWDIYSKVCLRVVWCLLIKLFIFILLEKNVYTMSFNVRSLQSYEVLKRHNNASCELIEWHFTEIAKSIKRKITLKRKVTDPFTCTVSRDIHKIKPSLLSVITRPSLERKQQFHGTRKTLLQVIALHLNILVHSNFILVSYATKANKKSPIFYQNPSLVAAKVKLLLPTKNQLL